MTDYPIRLSQRRHAFEIAKLNGDSQKMLDQDEFLYSYTVLKYIVENQPIKSAYEIGVHLQKLQISFSKYDQQVFRYLYLMVARDPPLITLNEIYDEKVGGGMTRIIAKPTKHGLKWLKENAELAQQAVEVKQQMV